MPQPSYAGVGLGAVPDFPDPVTIGQSGLPASVTITNASDAAEATGNVTVGPITLTPSCSNFTVGCAGGIADPGTFRLSPTAVGTGSAANPNACTGRTFNVVVVDSATGEVELQPVGDPVVLGPPSLANDLDVCRIAFTVDVLKMPNHDSFPGVPGLQTNQIGSAVGRHQNGLVGIGTGSDVTTVHQATPTVVTQATPTATLGQTISDTASVTGPAASPAPTGTVLFSAYGPDDATCAGPAAFASPAQTLSGGPPTGTASAGPFTPTAPGTYRWVASYSGDVNYLSVTTACNEANETSEVVGVADLSVTKTCDPGPVAPGALVNCSVSVSNSGPSPAANVSVSDDLPPGLTLVGTASGGGFTCTGGDPFVCTRPSVAASESATFTFTARAPGDAAPSSALTNSVTVSSATPEVGTGPNTATATTTIVACTITGTGNIAGTAGNDVICGSPGPDRIAGLAGNDVIFGLGGDDQLAGGPGDDQLVGGDGNDRLTADLGTDQLLGAAGDDRLSTGDFAGGDLADGGAQVLGDLCAIDAGDTVASCESTGTSP